MPASVTKLKTYYPIKLRFPMAGVERFSDHLLRQVIGIDIPEIDQAYASVIISTAWQQGQSPTLCVQTNYEALTLRTGRRYPAEIPVDKGMNLHTTIKISGILSGTNPSSEIMLDLVGENGDHWWIIINTFRFVDVRHQPSSIHIRHWNQY